jgi:cell division protein FtsL
MYQDTFPRRYEVAALPPSSDIFLSIHQMKLPIISSVFLFAFSIVSATLIGRDDITAAETEFLSLSEQALNATLDRLDAEEASLKKRGQTASCTTSNLSIRRELWVFFSHYICCH